MWELANKTPYGAERNWTRDRDGAHHWLVAVRATFDVDPDGRLTLADEQPPPLLAPEHDGEPGLSSLRYDSDLLAPKPTTDLLVLANAHAPRARPARTVPVTLRVGALRKRLLVHGERRYRLGVAGITTTLPEPFVVRPLKYEFAFGGMDLSHAKPRKHRIDERNPVGLGYARRRLRLRNTPAHTIEYPKGSAKSKGPAGFGPIDPSWMPRRALAGTYDAAWADSRRPLLPLDYDPAFALCSPADQRSPEPLRGGERVGLENMTRNGVLVFDVPRIHLEFASFFGGDERPHPAMLATVLIEPEESRVSLTWQSSLRVDAPEADYLDRTEIRERRGD